jgi:hypothetical protein
LIVPTTTTTAPTLRVRASALAAGEDGRARFQGAPFSGLAYRVSEAGVVQSIDVFADGRRAGVSDDWLDLPEGAGARAVVEALDAEGAYGPYFRGSALMEGVVYTFDPTGPCVLEEVYRRGVPSGDSLRSWFASGAARQWVRGREGRSWFEDGRLESKDADGITALSLTVDNDGRLRAVLVADASVFDLDATARFPLAAALSLVGPAVDTAWLAAFRDRTALAAVPVLRLIDSAAGPDVVDFFAALAGARTLSLTKNRALTLADVERLRVHRPDCVVHFEPADADPA